MRRTPVAAVLATAALLGCHDATPSGPTPPALARGGEAGPASATGKVAICHAAGRAEDPTFHEISVGANAVADHLNDHGDYLVSERTPCPPPLVVDNVRVCKAVAPGMPAGRAFAFDVNGEAFTLTGGACTDRTMRVGTPVTIRETVPAGTVLDAIAVSPGTAGSGDVATATASVVAGTDVATITFTDRALLGELQLCKRALQPGIFPGSTFEFRLEAVGYPERHALARAAALPGGGYGPCGSGGTYAVGTQVTVFEELSALPSSYGIRSSGIVVEPADRLVAGTLDLPQRTVQVTIGAGTTRVAYTNERTLVGLRLCKTGPANATGTVRLVIVGPPWSEESMAVDVPVNGCANANAFPPMFGVPIGATIQIRERIPTGQRVAGIAVDPADRIVGIPDLTLGWVFVQVGAGTTTVTFDDVDVAP